MERPSSWIVALVAMLVLAACTEDEHAVLMEVRSEARVERMDISVFRVRDTGLDALYRSKNRAVSRYQADQPDAPIRVALEFERPERVMVHLVGRVSTGQRRVVTRCYDVSGVVQDLSPLFVPVDVAVDVDEDGFSSTPLAYCVDTDSTGAQMPCRFACPEAAVDCADDDLSRFPGAPELCEDGIDQDCSGEDAVCGDEDNDGFRACRTEDERGCDCDDSFAGINPDAEDIPGDGIDQDCDGVDQASDEDEDSYPACPINERGEVVLTGNCDCDDQNPARNPGVEEVCTLDGDLVADEDCDGLFDELDRCRPSDFDGDGVNRCEPPNTVSCDQDDCNGIFTTMSHVLCGPNGWGHSGKYSGGGCDTIDLDGDGEPSLAAGGIDCDDTGDLVFAGASENCSDEVMQDCEGSPPCDNPAADPDGDGWVNEPEGCGDDPDRNPGAAEICNAVDDNCNGLINESMREGYACAFQGIGTRCASGEEAVDGYCENDLRTSLEHCGACAMDCNPEDPVLDSTFADACVDGNCQCGSSPACGGNERCCDGGCANLLTDMDHCGFCGVRCNPAQADSCNNGSCACGNGPACSGSDICCGGQCVNVQIDPDNCGGCGSVCGSQGTTRTCSAGLCACQSGFTRCPGDTTPTSCLTELSNNSNNCGACGARCGSNGTARQCVGGACACDSSHARCGGDGSDDLSCQTSIATTTNCGGCGVSCVGKLPNAIPVCQSQACEVGSCIVGYGDCNGGAGCETPLNVDGNCGGCGKTCSGGQECQDRGDGVGECVSVCGADELYCDGGCAKEGDSLCGCPREDCTSGLGTNEVGRCVSSNCQVSCENGYPRCGDSTCPGSNDDNRCGADCVDCNNLPNVRNENCNAGVCEFTCSGSWEDCDGDPTNGCEVDGSCP